ncbi:MAG: hypothetical protein M0R80_08120 [Proteobacteria bacterium]|jgi:ATP-dependent DNA ligase|nr:hypothetical protein [Pseudomonadota bacterium]
MQYIFPPRPKNRVPPNQLPKYEATGKWVVQRKFKGTRNVIQITPDGKVNFFNRHKEEHSQWTSTSAVRNQILALNFERGKEYWLDSELLHAKVSKDTDPYLKNRIVVFDVLMVAGTYLLGAPNQMERLRILDEICHHPTQMEPNHGIARWVSENLWMAETFPNDFELHFQEKINLPEIEGLVLRRRDSVLDSVGTKEYECNWLIRCRKPEGHYQF